MGRQALLEEFKIVLGSVKARIFPYVRRKPERICWRDYDAAQRNEYPDVIDLIARLIDIASEGIGHELVGFDATGKICLSKPDLAKLILAQQYDGRCNRISLGYMGLIKQHLHIHDSFAPSYKTLERAYSDPDVMMLLNDAFFITQQPVSNMEHNFSVDGTCFGTTIKVNWESSRDEILRLNNRIGDDDGKKKERTKKMFAKTILAAGTTFKIISSFAIAKSPFGNESPYLKPLLNQIAELYTQVAVLSADAAFLSRENCNAINEINAIPRIFPKDSISLRAKGSSAWRKMLMEFVSDTQRWLEFYHHRSIMETINSTIKRTQPYPIRKRLVVRKATEILARICVYNMRQLVYLKYTKGIELRFKPISQQLSLLNYITP